jgi:transcriptional regulator with XRE-family HTH domain
MAGRERTIDRATRLAKAAVERAGRELRDARLGRGLSLRAVAEALGISISQASRIELGQAPRVPYVTLAQYAAAVGLDLPLRTYPGGSPIRDRAQLELLADFRAVLHGSLRWAVEVPLPSPGDQRAWDGVVTGHGWRFGVEAETAIGDVQALLRRIALKQRDGGTDGVILVVRGTRLTRAALRASEAAFGPAFPISGRRALELLAAGVNPGGSAVVVMPSRRRASRFPPDG